MGIDPKIADALARNVQGKRPSSALGEVVRARGRTAPRDRGMNKAETRYAQQLEALKDTGFILRYRFEAVKLRLADRTYLTMDFMVQMPDGGIEFHDVKAFWKKAGKVGIEEDAAIKMKVAAEQYPEWVFKAVWERGGKWEERVF